MLKTTKRIEFVAGLIKTEVKIDGNSVIGEDEVINPKNFTKRKNQAKIAKSKNLKKPKNHDFFPNSKNIETGPGYFIFEAILTFINLRQVLVKAPILHLFDLKCHIRIKTNITGYAISRILS